MGKTHRKLPSSGWMNDIGFNAEGMGPMKSKKFYTRKGRYGKNNFDKF